MHFIYAGCPQAYFYSSYKIVLEERCETKVTPKQTNITEISQRSPEL